MVSGLRRKDECSLPRLASFFFTVARLCRPTLWMHSEFLYLTTDVLKHPFSLIETLIEQFRGTLSCVSIRHSSSQWGDSLTLPSAAWARFSYPCPSSTFPCLICTCSARLEEMVRQSDYNLTWLDLRSKKASSGYFLIDWCFPRCWFGPKRRGI